MTKTIVWFRQDLRINDNPALKAACDNGEIIPVYIFDEEKLDAHTVTNETLNNDALNNDAPNKDAPNNDMPNKAPIGGAGRWWLHHALLDLASSLENKLLVKKGNAQTILSEIATQYGVSHIVWNRMYEPWARKRDAQIKAHFKDTSCVAKSLNGSLLWEPWEVLKKDGTPYKVYTPYYRKGCLSQSQPRYPLARPSISLDERLQAQSVEQINALGLLPQIKWDAGIAKMWTPTEAAASEKLAWFINNAVNDYSDTRNLPAVRGTSQLSPYLHFGQISPNQIWYAITEAFNGDTSGQGVDTYLSEIAWREFSYYLLYHFDDMQQINFNRKFDAFVWRQSEQDLAAWQTGQTGVPIVDAGMRELYQTGYMHNRVRMIVGSYLVKNLLIDWREGERWFWDCLVDADTASNAAGWQWVAGSGADASPYFRIFNPILQGEKFDKEGEYVKTYCPELKDLPKKYIHKPWEAPKDVLSAANVVLGQDYPTPIVDLKSSRQRALDAFAQIKGASA